MGLVGPAVAQVRLHALREPGRIGLKLVKSAHVDRNISPALGATRSSRSAREPVRVHVQTGRLLRDRHHWHRYE